MPEERKMNIQKRFWGLSQLFYKKNEIKDFSNFENWTVILGMYT